MPGTSSPLPVEEEGTAACIAVISALAMERAPLDALLMAEPFSPIRVYQSGTGSVRAYDAARSALSAGASALVSWGIAGALTTDLSPGTILLPEHLLNSGGDSFVTDPRWRMEICRVLQPIFTVRGGRILEAAEILSTRGAKMCVAQKSGAIAVAPVSRSSCYVSYWMLCPIRCLAASNDGWMRRATGARRRQWRLPSGRPTGPPSSVWLVVISWREVCSGTRRRSSSREPSSTCNPPRSGCDGVMAPATGTGWIAPTLASWVRLVLRHRKLTIAIGLVAVVLCLRYAGQNLRINTDALIMVSVILWIFLRSVAESLLVIVPVVLAAAVTAALTVLLGLQFNFANIIALPLLLGVGVDSGIHMVHRMRTEPPVDGRILNTSTSRAVLASGLTTIASFGNLAFSTHLGMASMGQLLTLGMLVTLVATLILLPALFMLRITV